VGGAAVVTAVSCPSLEPNLVCSCTGGRHLGLRPAYLDLISSSVVEDRSHPAHHASRV